MNCNFRVRYNPEVQSDIQKIVDYYKSQTESDKLGIVFVKKLETALKKLNTSALHYQIRYDDVRLLPVPSFPYRVHYRVHEDDNIVFIEAIFHTAQNPKKWKSR